MRRRGNDFATRCRTLPNIRTLRYLSLLINRTTYLRRAGTVLGSLIFLSLAKPGLTQINTPPLIFDGEIRVRSEADGRDFNGDSALNTYTLLRTRFGVLTKPLDDISVYMQVQDTRTFGDQSNTFPGRSNLDLYQAYFEIRNLWQKPLTLQAGRQELVYGNQRLLGNVDFSNRGQAFDGVKLTIGEANTFDLFMMIIKESNSPVLGAATPASTTGLEDADNRLFGAYYQRQFNSHKQLHLYTLLESNQNRAENGERELQRLTLGSFGKARAGRFDFETEIALQTGKRQGQNVLAHMATGALTYTLNRPLQPSISLGYDYLSGMDLDDKDFKVFDTAFATNHRFYGFMDYFIDIPLNTNGQGLQDRYVKMSLPLTARWRFSAHYHNLRAARGARKNFGNEFDFVLSHVYNSVASFQFGMTFFLPGDLIEEAFLNDDIGIWGYTTLLVDF